MPPQPAAMVWVMPCPAPSDWELIGDVPLPREGRDGQPLGGFSAAALDSDGTTLWLLSDAPLPFLVPLHGVDRLGSPAAPPPVFGRRLPLSAANGQPFEQPLDGEGLVLRDREFWIVSEGRRTTEQPARLMRFDRRSGQLLQSLELPDDWRAQPGRGLDVNQGPESLTLLPPRFSTLLLAAERPLLQDPPGQVRLLGFGPLAGAVAGLSPQTPGFQPLGSFDLPLGGPRWGLTDLLAFRGESGRAGVPAGLLGLIRGYEAPARWWSRLVLLPTPGPAVPAPGPLQQWDLLAAGLTPENWEGLAAGPPLSDGRPTLLLVSDDNFSPLQANRLARIAPRCRAPR
ncbi:MULTISPECIES: esterase-like activity of phytase family protein [Synechococcales]|uniref:esterase-like activity of phytase family protein n=1 Tax=Synechococcus sp. CS-1325 TaxID=2847979 RepID=UPI00223B4BE8|nr:esterase-like activity of phytase family protein [Synechococcus sp. CS-1325]